MRRPSTFTDRRAPLEVKMTPMIDVVFLLLVFFVWSASFQIVEHVLPSQLSAQVGSAPANPNDPPPPEADFENVIIRISWNGKNPHWRVNDAELANLDQLFTRLTQISQIKPDAPVIIHPDPQVPLGDVLDVYDRSRLANFQKVQFAALEGS